VAIEEEKGIHDQRRGNNVQAYLRFQGVARIDKPSKYVVTNVDQLGGLTSKPDSISREEAIARFGRADDPSFYDRWADRSCAIAVIDMVLQSQFDFEGTLASLVELAYANGAYLENVGWKHNGMVELLRAYHLHAEIFREDSLYRCFEYLLADIFVIASIKSRVTAGGSHMILLKGFRKTKEETIIYVNDPYNYDGQGGERIYSLEELINIFNGRGVLVYPRGVGE